MKEKSSFEWLKIIIFVFRNGALFSRMPPPVPEPVPYSCTILSDEDTGPYNWLLEEGIA